jgi:hypothetical protein
MLLSQDVVVSGGSGLMTLKPQDIVASRCRDLRKFRPQAVVVSGRYGQRILGSLEVASSG